MTPLDRAVAAWDSWDTACTHEGLRKPGQGDSRARVLGIRVIAVHDALKALADLHGLDWQQLQRDATAHRRAGAHVRDALMAACAAGLAGWRTEPDGPGSGDDRYSDRPDLGSGFGPSDEVAKPGSSVAA